MLIIIIIINLRQRKNYAKEFLMNEQLQKLFDAENKIKVLVVGDLMLDEYIWGSVNRISPEAPVQVVEVQSENLMPGGAANVANNLVALGCDVYMAGAIGKDQKGDRLIQLLQEENIDCKGIKRLDHRPTINKIRVIAHSQQIIRIDREDKRPLTDKAEKEVIDYLVSTIPLVDGVICSDYLKGLLTDNILKTIITNSKRSNKLVFIDPKGKDFAKYKGANILTPNEHEVGMASGNDSAGDYDLTDTAEKLIEKVQVDSLLVTRGKDGMCLFEKGKEPVYIPTEAKEVYDVTGAGDTVIAAFAMATLSGLNFLNASKIANVAAGAVVGKVGTAVIHKADLKMLLEENVLRSAENILQLNELKQIVSQAKSYKKTVVFTNGCFDIIHGGHIEYLQKARNLGDILIVGLNSDSSVRKLKGEGRPLKAEQERSNILAALKYVDYITIFSEETPENLIQELRPDIIVKGSDYTIDQVVGRNIVEGYGGKVELVPIVEGLSTSALVNDIVKKFS